MDKSSVRIGILGCGNVAAIHAEAIRHDPDLRLVAVCSRSAASARKLAERFQVPWHTDIEQFLGDPSLQAVDICTPSGTHSALGCAAAKCGKNVLVEKPIDVSLAAADSLIEACERAGVCLGVSLQSRFLDAPRILKAAVDTGRFGTPVAASVYIKWYRTPDYYRSAPWRGTISLDGGGALINQAIHTVDLLRWMMGPVEALTAFSARRVHSQIEGEDTLVAALRFRSGALGVIEAGTSVYPGFKEGPHHRKLSKIFQDVVDGKRRRVIINIAPALALLLGAILPLAYSVASQKRLARSTYQRAVAMEIVDGEMETLPAGGWRAFGPGTHDYPVHARAATNLPPGRFVLNVTSESVRLQWRPAQKHSGGSVTREFSKRAEASR